MDTEREYTFHPSNSDVGFYTDKFGTTGKGKSVFAENAKQHERARGGLVVDAISYLEKNGYGMLPYEYELARRLALNLTGNFPRGACRRKSKLFLIN
ncbi:hypothetical protein ABH908_000408 [Pseudomonas frederiksbergensis]|uniref:hypothetical protein n=1 Tax=Pseudomonas TaxID=286 RepID=UPI003D256387